MLATVFSTNTIYEHNVNIRILPAPAYIHISSRTFGHQWGRLTRKSITYQNVTTYKGRHQENNLGEVVRAGGRDSNRLFSIFRSINKAKVGLGQSSGECFRITTLLFFSENTPASLSKLCKYILMTKIWKLYKNDV